MKIENVAVISLEDYAEYQELKSEKSKGRLKLTGITHTLNLESHTGCSKSISGSVILDLTSSGNCSFLLNESGNVNFGKLIKYLESDFFKKGVLSDLL